MLAFFNFLSLRQRHFCRHANQHSASGAVKPFAHGVKARPHFGGGEENGHQRKPAEQHKCHHRNIAELDMDRGRQANQCGKHRNEKDRCLWVQQIGQKSDAKAFKYALCRINL